jgi:hypothetical protein
VRALLLVGGTVSQRCWSVVGVLLPASGTVSQRCWSVLADQLCYSLVLPINLASHANSSVVNDPVSFDSKSDIKYSTSRNTRQTSDCEYASNL